MGSFLEDVRGGALGLLLEGEAGIGKTSFADHACRAADERGFRVVSARAARPETSLSYALLGDLFEALDQDVLDELPAPQKDALEVALIRRPGTNVMRDPRAVCLAALAVLRRNAAENPILVAVDDLQWMDASSARVISFLLQRLGPEPVGLLATRRTEESAPLPVDLDHMFPPDRLRRVHLGPMQVPEFVHLLRNNVSADLPRSVILKIHAVVQGNPFYGQELARGMLRRGLPGPGAPVQLPEDGFGAVQERVQSIPATHRSVLELAALASRPTVALLRSAVPDADVPAALDAAEDEGLVVLREGKVTFAHPLIASALTATLGPSSLRTAHARLAAALDTPEERARHLALSSREPARRIAEALELAHQSARHRGAAAAAAELALMALAYTPHAHSGERHRRGVVAGMAAFEAGDAAQARELLRQTLAAMPPGPVRAGVRVTLCEISWQDTVAVEELASRALEEVGDDDVTAAGADLMLAWVWLYRGDLTLVEHHVSAARARLGTDADPSARTDLLTVAAVGAFLAGMPHEALLDEAVRLEDLLDPCGPADSATIYSGARVTRGLIQLWAGDLRSARSSLEAELRRLEALGRYVARDEVLCYLAHLACRTGEWEQARGYVDEALEIGEESGHLLGRGQNIVPRAWLAAVSGDLAQARRDATESLELSTQYVDLLAAANARGVLGLVELSADQPAVAVEHLRRVVAFLETFGATHTGLRPFVADFVEALVATGQMDEAQAVIEDDRLMGRIGAGQPPSGVLVRAEATVAAARGRLGEAAASLRHAIGQDADLAAEPFELARTLLVAGEVERRRRRRPQARAYLLDAHERFERLGATTWRRRAALDLERVTSAAIVSSESGLTPREDQVARFVTEGLTNKEVADRMFLSVKTVEANLSRIYRKVGVRSRAELVSRYPSLKPAQFT